MCTGLYIVLSPHVTQSIASLQYIVHSVSKDTRALYVDS